MGAAGRVRNVRMHDSSIDAICKKLLRPAASVPALSPDVPRGASSTLVGRRAKQLGEEGEVQLWLRANAATLRRELQLADTPEEAAEEAAAAAAAGGGSVGPSSSEQGQEPTMVGVEQHHDDLLSEFADFAVIQPPQEDAVADLSGAETAAALADASPAALVGTSNAPTHVIRVLEGQEAARAMTTYMWEHRVKEVHARLLSRGPTSPEVRVLVACTDVTMTTTLGILLFTWTRRGKILLVHSSDGARNKGIGYALGRRVLEEMYPNGVLSIDSPACTAKAAVKLWLSLGFMGDESLLMCKLADDAAYIGARNDRVTFSYRPNETVVQRAARLVYLAKVKERHTDVAKACERGMCV